MFHEGDPALWLYLVRTEPQRTDRPAAPREAKDVVLELLGPGERFSAGLRSSNGGHALRRPRPRASVVVRRFPADVVSWGSPERHPSVVREMALLIGAASGRPDSRSPNQSSPVEARRWVPRCCDLADREGPYQDGVELPFHLTRQSLPGRHVRDLYRGAPRSRVCRPLAAGRDGGRSRRDGRLVVRAGRLHLRGNSRRRTTPGGKLCVKCRWSTSSRRYPGGAVRSQSREGADDREARYGTRRWRSIFHRVHSAAARGTPCMRSHLPRGSSSCRIAPACLGGAWLRAVRRRPAAV